MTDDEYLEALAAAAQNDTLDGRWDALALGTLGEAEHAALIANEPADPRFDDILAAFAPRPEGLDVQIADRLVALANEKVPSPLDLQPPMPRRWIMVAGPILVAALVLIGLLTLSSDAVVLPDYTLETLSGEQVVRGTHPTQARPRYGPGSRLDVVARPLVDTSEAVAVRIFVQRGATFSVLPVTVTPSAIGSFRLVGAVDELLPAVAGRQTLVFVIGPSGTLPADGPALKTALDSGATDTGWQVLRHPFERVVSR